MVKKQNPHVNFLLSKLYVAVNGHINCRTGSAMAPRAAPSINTKPLGMARAQASSSAKRSQPTTSGAASEADNQIQIEFYYVLLGFFSYVGLTMPI